MADRSWSQLREMAYGSGVAFSPIERVAYDIMDELDGRKNLTRDLDDEIKDEIFESFLAIIRKDWPKL